MRTARRLSLLLAVMILVACSPNPTNRWAQARSTLSTVQDTVRIAHSAGVIDDDVVLTADPIAQAARSALEEAETFLPEHYMQLVDAMLARLEEMAIAGELDLGGD